MKLAQGLCVFALLSAIAIAPVSADEKPEQLAQKSAQSWLTLTDEGKYSESWDAAAQMFKSAVTKEQWQSAMKGSREPLGKMRSRRLKAATYTKTLPGAPDGEYVVIQFDTSFEHKQSAVETVTPMLDTDGKWKVSGYYIK
jgi:hypothetical protein